MLASKFRATNFCLQPLDPDTPSVNATEDVVYHHKALSLCSNNGFNVSRSYHAGIQIPPSIKLKHTASINILMLMVCGDIQVNPGPTNLADIFPCAFCEIHVNWSQDAVCCDECDHWYHKTCISMSSSQFAGIGDVSWKCFKCSTPNCSSFLYQHYNVSISNSFASLSNIPGDDTVFNKTPISPFAPTLHSSPCQVGNTRAPHSTATASTSSIADCTCSSSATPRLGNFRIVVANINGARGKTADVEHLCNYMDPDALIFCETKVNNKIHSSEFLPANYRANCFRKDRTSEGGGVLIALKSHYVVEEVELIDVDCEVVWVKIVLQNCNPMFISSFYRPPSDNILSLDSFEKSFQYISNMCKNNPTVTFMTAGDFNAPDIDWDLGAVKPDSNKKGICQKVIDIFNTFGLVQLQNSPTRGDNILDLFGTNKPNLVKSIKNIPGISDHDALAIDMDIQAQLSKKPPHKVFKWGKADWDSMKADTIDFSKQYLDVSGNRSVSENYSSIENHLKKVLNTHVPSKMSRIRSDVPWLTNELKRQCRRKQRLYNKSKKSGKREHKEAYSRMLKDTQSKLKQARWQYINGILQSGLEDGNSKPFWGYIRSQKQDNIGVSPLKKDGHLHSDRSSKCDILASQFKSVFTKDQDDPYKDTTPFGPSYPDIDPLEIRESGVKKLLMGINPNKASGPDEIPCKLLKELSNELAPIFTHFFRQTYLSGELPSSWTQAWITPVFKKGQRNLAENYRPVSLTCVSCKLFEHILCTHIRGHLDKHGVLTPFNHGFRAKHSCESQLLTTTHDFFTMLDKHSQVDVAVLDFSKAFDTVPHRRLLRKLEHCGINGHIHKWIGNFLCDRTQCVMVDGTKSREDTVDSGVPQGTVLGPLLFLIHISDLPTVVDPNTAVRLFADDCLIYRPIKCIADQHKLQNDLDALSLWGRCWGMKFNEKKCNILHLGKKRLHHFYQLNGIVLESVSQAKYLGVTISDDLSWSPHISSITSKAHQRLGFLKRNLRGSPFKCRELAYSSLVRSQVDYCASIWDPTLKRDILELEKIQRKAARWVKGSYGVVSVTGLLRDLKWQPLADRRRDQRLILIYKILNSSISIPPKSVDIHINQRPQRGSSNPHKLIRPKASHPTSPLWTSSIYRTIPQWNSLPATIAEADSITSFKSQLSTLSP